ncbi:MAG: hypothetical protein Q8R16_05310, partial [bacterium]|nr:hypothetical protein [bacterium]
TPGAPDVVVFLTLGLVEEMRQIKRLYPNVKIIGFTGAFPRDEIILVPKQWNLGLDGLRSAILD